MVVALFILTLAVFFAVDFFLRREDRVMEKKDKAKKSPIFLSPDKALIPLINGKERLFHLSHSWVQKSDEEYVYVGYDNFIPFLFSSKIKINELPLIGSEVPQGTKIWEVESNGRRLEQLAPVAGEVVEINPAFSSDLALPSEQVEKSWIVKMKTSDIEHDSFNLMPNEQALRMNTILKDEIYQSTSQSDYVNDGGRLDSSFINNMDDDAWKEFIHKFFPHQKNI